MAWKDKEIQKAYHKKYSKAYCEMNKEKERTRHKIYYEAHKEEERAKKKTHGSSLRKEQKAYREFQSLNLTDIFVKHRIASNTGILTTLIPPELIELKRTIILIKREIKSRRTI